MSEHTEAKIKLVKWLSDYGHLLDHRDIAGLDDVFGSLQAGHTSFVEEFGKPEKSDREEHFNEGAFI